MWDFLPCPIAFTSKASAEETYPIWGENGGKIKTVAMGNKKKGKINYSCFQCRPAHGAALAGALAAAKSARPPPLPLSFHAPWNWLINYSDPAEKEEIPARFLYDPPHESDFLAGFNAKMKMGKNQSIIRVWVSLKVSVFRWCINSMT